MFNFLEDSPVLQQVLSFVAILLMSVVAAWLILFIMQRLQRLLAKRNRTTLMSKFVGSLSKPVFVIILIEGLIQALSRLPVVENWGSIFNQVSTTILVIFGIYCLARILSVALELYLLSDAFQRAAHIDEGLVRLLKRVMIGVVYIIGLLILLDYYGVSISPILASLGIGGLAVALAVQPMLANFFAGTQIVSDRVVRVGDFVELEEGLEGYVTDLGWRSTRIRTLMDTFVIIPNSKLADSVVTNYHFPDKDIMFEVNGAVTYESDLFYVENVVRQVAEEVLQDCEGAVKTFAPWFVYEECGDANINFWVRMKATDRYAVYTVKSELIKRLRTRFQHEGFQTTLITG